jgi:putative membrane-bound dehydrogenase-like protein
LTILLLTSIFAADHVVNGKTFSLPDGFLIECVAKPPLVKHPVHAAFDEKGRLLVTEVSGSNAPIKEQLKTLPHKVVRLTDDNGDGVFERSELWAKDLPMPQGILWYKGSAYVAAPPAIWKLESKPDDTGSLPKTVWYDPKTATGCNNDLHGPWLGPDGWFYWTKGAFAEQTHELTNGKKLTTKASMLLRRKPEGGPVDVLMTGGMDNPVGLAFLPNGDRIVSATFLHHPHGGLRDGLVHALYGGVYGKDHDAIDGLPRTGDLLPVMTDLGPAAPSSVICYEAPTLGDWSVASKYRGNLLLCQFNLHRISRHEIAADGATYKTRDSEFLTSSDIDFHPTDVFEDDFGNLLVIDTGGWYKLCCPTSQLPKPEVFGAIYRIRPKLLPGNSGPSGLISRKHPQYGRLFALTSDSREAARRRSIVSMGREMPTRELVESLVEASSGERDRAMTHSLRYALWELDSPELVERLADEPKLTPLSIAAALWAVSQNPKWKAERFTVERLLGWAQHAEPELAAAARFALQQRKEFADQGVAWLKKRLTGTPWADGSWQALRPLVVVWLNRTDMQQAVAEWTSNRHSEVRRFCWQLMADFRSKAIPSVWIEAAGERIKSANVEELSAMLPVVRRAGANPKLIGEIRRRSLDRALAAEIRFDMMSLAPSESLDAETFGELTASLDAEKPVAVRTAAADALGASKLSVQQAMVLTTVLVDCGPLEIERLLRAFTATKNAPVGEALAIVLERAKSRKALRIDDLKKRFEAFGPSVLPAIARLEAKFAADRANETKRLDELTTKLPKGDAKRGLIVFNGSKAACRSCHKLGYVGGDLGPELSKIGSIRGKRDLLESVVFPNASFVRSYEPTTFALKDGRNVNGLIRRETTEEIVVATGLNQEQRIAKSDVESRIPGSVSMMPTGMDQQLSPQELSDLIAFLESAK